MKKITIFCAALALLATVSSCKKDQETVTLGAVIDQNAKVYVDDHLPSWENGDQMVINDETYAITAASGGNGQINNVTAARSYRAIYPASLVAPGIDLVASPSVPVTLPATQAYALVDNHQRCELPMGAYLTSGNTLLFHNLCSVVRVTVNNQTNDALDVTSITIAADNAILSGEGTATIAGQADDAIVMSATGGHEVTLAKSDNTAMETLSAGNGTAVFDIVVPAFATADNVTITVNTTENTITIAPFDGTPTEYGMITMPGTYQGWDPAANAMNPMAGAHVNEWWADVTFDADAVVADDQGVKFANGSWDVNWGSEAFPYGIGTQGGKNIRYKKGTYRVYFNDLLGIYYFIEQ